MNKKILITVAVVAGLLVLAYLLLPINIFEDPYKPPDNFGALGEDMLLCTPPACDTLVDGNTGVPVCPAGEDCPGGCGSVCSWQIYPDENNCLIQKMPVGDSMPIIPECDKYMLTVQWNAYVYPKPTTWTDGVPIGLRYRNCPSLYCDGIGTAYAYCENPTVYDYKCSDQYLYLTEIVYRLPVDELGYRDEGYWGRMNYWGWYPICLLSRGNWICYTDWSPSSTVAQFVADWKALK